MPNDKGDDELFEDLDKFFAPIRDVDWDEPDDATTQAPQEAHVEVRAEPAAPAPEPTGELPVVAAPEEPDAGDAWYDSGALAPIDELLGEPEPADVDDDVVLVVDEEDDEDEAGQHGLFEEDDDTADDEVDERIVGDAPSDEDLEAATAHFAGSLGEPGDVSDRAGRRARWTGSRPGPPERTRRARGRRGVAAVGPGGAVAGAHRRGRRRRVQRAELAGAGRRRGRRRARAPGARAGRARRPGGLPDRGAVGRAWPSRRSGWGRGPSRSSRASRS